MIRAVIFDCFGVLYHGSLDELYERAGERWLEVRDLSRAADRGMITRDDFFREAAPLVRLSTAELVALVNRLHVPNKPAIDFVRSVKEQYKTALLSNISDSTIGELFPPELRETLFDAIVVSSDIGYAKPDSRAYEHTAAKLGVAPEECVMIDDMTANIVGAKAAGMQAVHFTETTAGIAAASEMLYARTT